MILQISTIIIALMGGALIDIFGVQSVLAIGSLFGIVAIIFYQKIKE